LKKTHLASFAIALTLMCLYGCLDMSRSVASPMMQRDWHLSYAALGTLFMANSLGYLVGSFLSGFASDKRGAKWILLTGGALSIIGITLVIFFPPYLLIWLAFFTMGFGTGWLEIGVNGVVPAVSITTEDQAKRFNLIHGFYGLGATIFPVIAAYIIHVTHTWKSNYLLLDAAFFLIFLLTLLKVPVLTAHQAREDHSVSETQADTQAPEINAFTSPLFYCFVIALSVYVMAESGLAAWLITYLSKARHFSLAHSSWYLTGFYATFTIGRLTGHTWIPKIGARRAVIFSSLFSFVSVVIALVWMHGLWLFFVAGAGFAIIFPTIVSIASDTFPHQTGRVLGMLFTASGIGSLLINGIIGLLANQYGLFVGVMTIPVMMLVVVGSMAGTLIFSPTGRLGQAHP
jgi:fucose permease